MDQREDVDAQRLAGLTARDDHALVIRTLQGEFSEIESGTRKPLGALNGRFKQRC